MIDCTDFIDDDDDLSSEDVSDTAEVDDGGESDGDGSDDDGDDNGDQVRFFIVCHNEYEHALILLKTVICLLSM